ncbi:MAG TPA: hypothetical protein DEH78_17830, partial [Solibacterales bacterium]|nr:hypothetical protein [Bryobacterales bacterium]
SLRQTQALGQEVEAVPAVAGPAPAAARALREDQARGEQQAGKSNQCSFHGVVKTTSTMTNALVAKAVAPVLSSLR